MSERGRSKLFGRPGELLVDEPPPRISMPLPPPRPIVDDVVDDSYIEVRDADEEPSVPPGPLRVYVGPPSARGAPPAASAPRLSVVPDPTPELLAAEEAGPGMILSDAAGELGDVLGPRAGRPADTHRLRVGADTRTPRAAENPPSRAERWVPRQTRLADPAAERAQRFGLDDRARTAGIATAAARGRRSAAEEPASTRIDVIPDGLPQLGLGAETRDGGAGERLSAPPSLGTLRPSSLPEPAAAAAPVPVAVPSTPRAVAPEPAAAPASTVAVPPPPVERSRPAASPQPPLLTPAARQALARLVAGGVVLAALGTGTWYLTRLGSELVARGQAIARMHARYQLAVAAAPPAAVEDARGDAVGSPSAVTTGQDAGAAVATPLAGDAVAPPAQGGDVAGSGADAARRPAFQQQMGLIEVVCARRATIYVDGVRKGLTTDAKPIELSAGVHTVKVVANGFSRTQQVRVDPGKLRLVEFRLR